MEWAAVTWEHFKMYKLLNQEKTYLHELKNMFVRPIKKASITEDKSVKDEAIKEVTEKGDEEK